MKVLGLQEFSSMMNLPYFVALLVAFAETVGIIGIIVGGLLQSRIGDIITRLAGLAIIPVVLGAIFMLHWGQWSFVPSVTHQMGGMEFQVTLMLLALFLLLRGTAPDTAPVYSQIRTDFFVRGFCFPNQLSPPSLPC